MKVDVVLGLQWGDEGKGKEIDEMLSHYDGVARFQGADNAGHSFEFKGVSVIGHLLPSGCLHPYVDMFIGNGVALNPVSLKKEIKDLQEKGIDVRERLFISERAKLVTYLHPFLDQAEECRMGKISVGSTQRGVGPAYRDFKGRQGLSVGDILSPNFPALFERFEDFSTSTLRMYQRWGYEIPWVIVSKKKTEWLLAVEEMKELNVCDVSEMIRKKLFAGEKILAEGAQGAMLDCDFGDYPYVTSSNTLTANVCLGLGIPHTAIGKVFGVIKAYTTKVGGGHFPSRIKDEKVEKLFQELGKEYGATTGRSRMCGWIDLVALKRALYLSGATGLFINKADICPVEKIKVVTEYLGKNGKVLEDFPLHLEEVANVKTREFSGWGNGACGTSHKRKLPKELITYIDYLEKELSPLGVSVISIGTGPKRGQSVKWHWKMFS